MSPPSLLDVVLAADNFPMHSAFPYPSHHPVNLEQYIPFHLCAADYAANVSPVGLIRPIVLQALLEEKNEADCPWNFITSSTFSEGKIVAIAFASSIISGGRHAMDNIMAVTASRWKELGMFPEALDGWRDERYAVYASPQSVALAVPSDAPFRNIAFELERSACAIWGFSTYGVHLTAYEGSGDDMKIWVPRRSMTKATWPGMLDNTVAGGIPAGLSPLESIVKECDEEASLPETLVRKYVRNVGAATYFFITTGGFLQPEIEYLYDLQLPDRDSDEYSVPHPHDDEVESFTLLSLPEIYEALHGGQFKPNCGLILVDFLFRHGLVTPENEKNYLQIQWHMRRRIGMGVPS